jgi:uncharacterized protein YhdP
MFKKKLSRRKKRLLIILASVLVVLIAFRIALPYILLRYVNKQLASIEGYKGHVDDIDVSLYRGAFTIEGIRLDKTSGKIPVPFFKAEEMDLSIEWRALFHGRVAAEIEVQKPVFNFVNGPTKATSQTGIGKHWTEVIDNLLPFKLNRVELKNGQVHYRDYHSSPQVDIYARQVHVLAENLSNAKHAKGSLPSTAVATALVYNGTANVNMKIDPLSRVPLFDLNAKLTNVDLTYLNNFLRAYGNFDVERGRFSLYSEAAAKDNRISGYTKPIIKDIKVVSWKEDKKKPLKLIWESLVGAVAWILTNHKKDQIATKATFEGRLDDPDISVLSIIGQLLRNAFIQALVPSLENNININSPGKKEENPTALKQLYNKTKTPAGK